jgi:hypothetical protein
MCFYDRATLLYGSFPQSRFSRNSDPALGLIKTSENNGQKISRTRHGPFALVAYPTSVQIDGLIRRRAIGTNQGGRSK